MDSPQWECGNCHKFATELFYCSGCWRVICAECYDEFVGTCKDCVKKLFDGQTMQSPGMKSDEDKSTATNSANTMKHKTPLCPKCRVELVETPNGEICCTKCGLVVLRRKIDPSSKDFGPIDEDRYSEEEDETWWDVGLPDMTEDDLPDGYDDELHPE